MMNNQTNSNDQTAAGRSAEQLLASLPYVKALIAIVPLFYAGWFMYNHQEISTLSSDWGAFGDFVGGIVNPLVAFFALLWLITAVRLQREELTTAKQELKKSADALNQTVKHNEAMKRIDDCRMLIELTMEDINELKQSSVHIDIQEMIFGSEASLTHSYTLEECITEVALRTKQGDHPTGDVNELLNAGAGKLANLIMDVANATQEWDKLHGPNCNGAKFYKRKLCVIATHLNRLNLIDTETANILIYTITQKPSASD